MVDISAHKIVGKYLLDKDKEILITWAKSKHLWTRRIAVIANWWLIRENDLSMIFKISKILLKDEHDLIHKAVGWMLREAGKRDLKRMESFLKRHYKNMPRTMLRYSIEKLPEKRRKLYLTNKV